MKTLTIIVPDHIHSLISVEAENRSVDAAALCSGVIVEHFLGQPEERIIKGKRIELPSKLIQPPRPSDVFDVDRQFPGYPKQSIELAQGFVDEALRMPNTKAFRADGVNGSTGVGFRPNFVFIQYLQKREPGGIMVSFYGQPHRHGIAMQRGQGNYSRIKVLSVEGLAAVLPEIRLAHKLKFD